MSKLCPYCKSKKVGSLTHTVACCTTCHRVFGKSQLIDNTVFQQITSSPEVLAEDLVYSYGAMWESTIIVDTTFDTYEEAYAATVEKLKEVANG